MHGARRAHVPDLVYPCPRRRRQRPPARRHHHGQHHLGHVDAIAALRRLLQRLRDAGGAQAPALACELCLRLSAFVGENLEHMAEEESVLTQALWAHFSADEIIGLETALAASLAPQEMAFSLRWMAQGLNATATARLLAGARAQVPEPVFAQLADTVQAAMPPDRWARVASALGLPAVPGLVAS